MLFVIAGQGADVGGGSGAGVIHKGMAGLRPHGGCPILRRQPPAPLVEICGAVRLRALGVWEDRDGASRRRGTPAGPRFLRDQRCRRPRRSPGVGLVSGCADDRSRLGHPLLGFAQQHAQIVRHRREDRRRPASAGSAGRPLPTAGSRVGSSRQGAPARTIQRRALKTSRSSWRRWGALRHHQGQIRRHKDPFVITHVRRVRLAGASCFPSPKPTKCITGSNQLPAHRQGNR